MMSRLSSVRRTPTAVTKMPTRSLILVVPIGADCMAFVSIDSLQQTAGTIRSGAGGGSRRAANGGLTAVNGGYPVLMKRRIFMLAAVLAVACGSGEPELAKDTLLWRVDEWTESAPSVRMGMATILAFRSSGEFVELHCRVI